MSPLHARESIMIPMTWRTWRRVPDKSDCKHQCILTSLVLHIVTSAGTGTGPARETHFCVYLIFRAAQNSRFFYSFKIDDTSNEILRCLTSCVSSLAITSSVFVADSGRATPPTGVAGAQMPVCVASGARRFARDFRDLPDRSNQLFL